MYEERERVERIADVRQDGNRLTIVLDIFANCGAKFLPKAELNGAELWLDWSDVGEPKECGCCFELDYVVDLPEANIVIKYKGKDLPRTKEKFVTYPIKYDLKNGDTINYFDKYGRRQGLHISSSGRTEVHWIDGTMIKRIIYHSNGKIQRLQTSDIDKFIDDFHFRMDSLHFLGLNHYVEYFETGRKKKECQGKDWKSHADFPDAKCKEWNENGDLIYE